MAKGEKVKHYIAIMETEHFSWLAVGKTEEEARNAIAKAWNKKDGYHRERQTTEQLDSYYGINVYDLADGECHWA